MNLKLLTLGISKPVTLSYLAAMSTLLLTSCTQMTAKDQTQAKSSNQCSIISVLGTPRVGQELYPVSLNKVDGKPVHRNQQRIKVQSGKHQISVYGNFSRGLETVRNKGPHKAKILEANLEPNRIYYVKAQFLKEKRQQTYNSKHWEPVVWKSLPMEVSCG